jgi:hypothetical protein
MQTVRLARFQSRPVQAKTQDPITERTKVKRAGGLTQVVERLLSKHKALSSTSNSAGRREGEGAAAHSREGNAVLCESVHIASKAAGGKWDTWVCLGRKRGIPQSQGS